MHRQLPLQASDFASVCFTAHVRRAHLLLVLVTRRERCVAIVFDARRSVADLLRAARHATAASDSTPFWCGDQPLGGLTASMRLDEAVFSLPTNIGGALFAYRRYTTAPSLVCNRTVADVLAVAPPIDHMTRRERAHFEGRGGAPPRT